MRSITLSIISIQALAFMLASCNQKPSGTTAAQPEGARIFPKGEIINNGNFKGTAYLHMLVTSDSLNPTHVGNVSFEPGARTNWHYHPGGQILLATGGVGYYQEMGQPKIILRKGDVVKCPPNTPHWHGASADTAFIQLAITNNANGPTVWLEAVTDETYGGQ